MNSESPAKLQTTLSAYLDSIEEQLKDGLSKIQHCLKQLTDEQVWWRPADEMNSIANLLLHLSGNLRQWFISGLKASPDLRQRQLEFDDRSRRSPQILLDLLAGTIQESCDVLQEQSWEDLLSKRHVQEFDFNGFQTIADSLCHFRGHVQEIIHMTRVQKGEDYEFAFVPVRPD
ncbi:MAG: DUF1572 family protein [Planctomycetota bacterium]